MCQYSLRDYLSLLRKHVGSTRLNVWQEALPGMNGDIWHRVGPRVGRRAVLPVSLLRPASLLFLGMLMLPIQAQVAGAENGASRSGNASGISSPTEPAESAKGIGEGAEGARSGPRGMITSSRCPLSCADLALPEGFCRSWRAGDVCYVEDYTQPPGHRSMIRLPPTSQKPGQTSSKRRSSLSGMASGQGISGQRGRMENQTSDKRRGFVTSTSCPFSCRDAKIPQEHCRERRVGNRCEVEDLRLGAGHQSMIRIPLSAYRIPGRQTAGARSSASTSGASRRRGGSTQAASAPANRRGMITSAQCPYSCRMAGVPADFCREWKAGPTCYVEDYTQAPGHRSMIRIPR